MQERRDSLAEHGLGCWAIANHLNGQAVCEAVIYDRYRNMVNPRVWGDGDPEGVRQRAAEEMKPPPALPPVRGGDRRRVYRISDLALRGEVSASGRRRHPGGVPRLRRPLLPDLDVLDEVGVRFAHEVHPFEIADD